jgi:hypothetical protein
MVGDLGLSMAKKPNVERHYPQIEEIRKSSRGLYGYTAGGLNPSRNRPQEHGGHKKKSQKEQIRCTNTRPHQIRGGRSHEFGRDLEPPRWPANSVSARFLSLCSRLPAEIGGPRRERQGRPGGQGTWQVQRRTVKPLRKNVLLLCYAQFRK